MIHLYFSRLFVCNVALLYYYSFSCFPLFVFDAFRVWRFSGFNGKWALHKARGTRHVAKGTWHCEWLIKGRPRLSSPMGWRREQLLIASRPNKPHMVYFFFLQAPRANGLYPWLHKRETRNTNYQLLISAIAFHVSRFSGFNGKWALHKARGTRHVAKGTWQKARGTRHVVEGTWQHCEWLIKGRLKLHGRPNRENQRNSLIMSTSKGRTIKQQKRASAKLEIVIKSDAGNKSGFEVKCVNSRSEPLRALFQNSLCHN